MSTHRTRHLFATRVTCLLALCLSLLSADAARAQNAPRVLVDLSHEFTFRYDIFGLDKYWSGATAIEKTSSFASLTPGILAVHDVLVVSQVSANVAFSPEVLTLIDAWVSAGGGLWIAGDRFDFAGGNPGKPYPLEALANRFGASFSTTARVGNYVVQPHALTSGVVDLRVDEGNAVNVLALTGAGWQPLITDAAAHPVIAVRSFGLGRVMVSAQDAIISNPYQRPDVGNVALARNLVAWLAAIRSGDRSNPVPIRVLPEIKVSQGQMEVYYPATIHGEPGIDFMRVKTQVILDALETSVHGVALDRPFRVVALVGAGGGYSSGSEIGIAAMFPPENMLLVIAHELTHSFDITGGTPPEWMHGWPSFAAIRVARLTQFGASYQAVANQEYDSRVAAYLDYERIHGSNTLDITEVDRGTFVNAWGIGGKLMRLIESIETLFGSDVMPRMYRIKRQYGSSQPQSTEQMIHWLSLAAGADLYDAFAMSGAMIGPRLATLPVVVATNPPSADPRTWGRIAPPLWDPVTPLTAAFNMALDMQTVAAAATVTGDRLGARVVAASPSGARGVTFTVSPPLLPCEHVTFRLGSGLRDLSGRPLDGNGNGVAEGVADAFQWQFTVACGSAPAPPSNLRVSAVVGDIVTLRWTPPLTGTPATNYIIEGGVAPGQTLASVSTGSSAPSLTFSAPPGQYFVRVRSKAPSGVSAPSNEAVVVVQSAVPPSAPANLQGLAVGSTLTLTWTDAWSGGAPESIFLDVTGSASVTVPIGVGGTFNYSGVPAGSYTFRLRAANRFGTSGSSAPVTLTFPATCSGIPAVPDSVAAYYAGGLVYLDWNPPATGPAATAYVIAVSGSAVASLTTASLGVSGAVGSGTYAVSIAGQNACGTGPSSAVRTVVVP